MVVGRGARVRSIAAVIGLAALLGTSLLAQSPPSGKLNGRVVDTSDNVMPGVSIALRGPESRSTVTDRDGAFAFSALPFGDYELRAGLDGFATVVRTVTVTNSIEPLRIRMRVGRNAGEIAGMVRDVSGALLAGVSVEVTSPDLVERFRATTTGSSATVDATMRVGGHHSDVIATVTAPQADVKVDPYQSCMVPSRRRATGKYAA